MKWLCAGCKAINPEFSYSCHNCGARNNAVGSKTPSEILRQGKYECGAAALAILLGHTLFNVKRVLGSFGWRNDFSGVSETKLRLAAREFGRDLVWCNKRSMQAMKNLPDGILTIPSLNYPKSYHGVAWFRGEIIDPNFGNEKRKYWFADADMTQIPISSASVILKEPLSDDVYKELVDLQKSKFNHTFADEVLKIAG